MRITGRVLKPLDRRDHLLTEKSQRSIISLTYVYTNIPFFSSQMHVIPFESYSLCLQGTLQPEEVSVILVFNKKSKHFEISHPESLGKRSTDNSRTHSLTNQPEMWRWDYLGSLLYPSTCFVKWTLKCRFGTNSQKMLNADSCRCTSVL